LSILNSDELYPAVWKAFVKYGRSELTHRVDEVVSGMSTPTRPLPAACKSFSVAIAEKLTSNEETLSDDGMVAVGEFDDVPPPPPHAIATNPTSTSVGNSLANLNLGLSSGKGHLLPSSRRTRGESAPAHRSYSAALAESRQSESIAQPRQFVKRLLSWPGAMSELLTNPGMQA
jgi:hypothetical protein